MCQYSSEDGFAGDWHLVHLGSRALGGAALVMTEATAVTADGRISPQDLGIWKDEHVEGLSRCARFIKERGAVAGMQLAHAGRKASTSPPWDERGALSEDEGGWRPIWAPSEIPFTAKSIIPSALGLEQIQEIVTAFTDAGQRALRAGFQLLEIHAAHGYLLHDFLSPLSNQRKDAYGGSLENRMRIVCEVVAGLRAVWPDELPLFMRISATDWAEGGWNVDESVELARTVKLLGVDLIDCSSGGLVSGAKIPTGPGYQVPFAERIRREAEIATAAVGLIYDARQADEIIERQQADMVFLARQMLREPYWPLHAAKELGASERWPVQYQRAAAD